MTQDVFNIDQIYPTKPNTQSWIMDNNKLDSQGRIEWGSKTEPQKTSGGFWEMKDNSQVRMNATTVKAVSFKDTCTEDFAKAAKAGNMGITDGWRDVEMTMRFKLDNFSPSDGRLILKGPTMRHHSNQVCCSGRSYGCRFFLNGNPMKFQWFKEMWHVNYESRPDDEFDTKFGELADGNEHVVKFVCYNKTIDDELAVHLEAYIDFDGDGKKFVKVAETDDTGGWGSDGGECNGKDDQILSWSSGFMCYRWDASSTDLEFKDCSVRHIDPFGSIDVTPTDPSTGQSPILTTQRLVIPLVLSFDVNAMRTSSCALPSGGGGGAVDPYYTRAMASPPKEKELSDSSTHGNRKRIANVIVDTGSDLYNQKPQTFKTWLKKQGTPNTNNVVAKIWGSGSSSTVKFTCPTVVTDAGLTGSYAEITFDFSTNTYTMKVGDRVGIEYLGTSSSNYVIGAYNDDISGNGTSMEQYEGSSWERKTTRELCCSLYV